MSRITAGRRIRASDRTTVLIAAALATSAVAAPADAQTYFAREVIKAPQAKPEAPATWSTGPWSAYSSGCSAAATQTRSVVCSKADGWTVPDASCAAPKPDATRSEPRFDGCSHSATFGQYTACSNGYQSAAIATCTRSDGTAVPVSNCPAQTDTRACTVLQPTCSPLTSTNWYRKGSGAWSVEGLDFASNVTEALQLCRQHTARTGKSGICGWDSTTTGTSFVSGPGALPASYSFAPYLYAGTCQ